MLERWFGKKKEVMTAPAAPEASMPVQEPVAEMPQAQPMQTEA